MSKNNFRELVDKIYGKLPSMSSLAGVTEGKNTSHPVHGSSTENNFKVDGEQWHCFRHDSGGSKFEWIAVKNGIIDCENAGSGCLEGSDFIDVLEIAGDQVNIDLDINPKDRREYREKARKLQELYAFNEFVANYSHRKLIDNKEMKEWVKNKYGFSEEVLEDFKIGYAPNSKELMKKLINKFGKDKALKSGLFIKAGDGLISHFQGRVVFPYFRKAKPRYFIARRSPNTPDNEYEKSKYKKQLTHSDKHEYVSELVKEPLFGRDSISESEEIIITEGITDAISSLSRGIATISPVTTKLKKEHSEIINDLLYDKKVYITMDNEKSEAGFQGSLNLIQKLQGCESYLIVLPRENGKDKTDLNDYFADHTKEEFGELMKEGIPEGLFYEIEDDKTPARVIDERKNLKEELIEKVFDFDRASWNYETKFVTFIKDLNLGDKKIHYLDTYELPEKLTEKLVGNKIASYGIWECTDCGKKHYSEKKPWKCDNHDSEDHEPKSEYKFLALHPTEPIEIGDTLLDNYKFKTPIESIDEASPGRMHLYKRGIYNPDKAKGVIKNKVKKLNHYCKQSDQRHVINHITSLEQVSEHRFGLSGSRVVLRDGTLNLETLGVNPHDPDNLALSRIDIEFDPQANCERFKKYLKEVIPIKKDRKRLQEVLGTALVDEKLHKKGMILLGPTDSGKSTFIRIVREVFGKENVEAESPHALSHRTWAKANLRGTKLNATDEVSENKLKNIEILKRIMDGNPIKGEHKREKRFEFTPTCEHIYAANQTPTANRKDDAFWNRWITIEMPDTVPEEEQDPDLPRKIIEKERKGIFNWIVQGYKDFIGNGKHFTYPVSWEETRDNWLSYGSALQRFIQKFIVPDPKNKISAKELYEEVIDFADREKLDAPSSQKQVTEEIKKIPSSSYSENYIINGKRHRGFKGIMISESEDETESQNHTSMSSKEEAINRSVELVKEERVISDNKLEKELNLSQAIELKDFWLQLRRHNSIDIDGNNVLHYNKEEKSPQREKVISILEKLEDLQDGEPVYHNDLIDELDLPTKEFNALIENMKKNKDILEPKVYYYKIKGGD